MLSLPEDASLFFLYNPVLLYNILDGGNEPSVAVGYAAE